MPLPGGADAEAGDDGEAPLLSPAEGGAPPQMPKWYTPKRLLALFCVMQYMVYMDRGVRASCCRGPVAPPKKQRTAKTS